MSAFQLPDVQQPVSINWHVQDGTNNGILKVYLFQKNPESKPIVRWKKALVKKLNQYNIANHANRGLFTVNADGSTTSHYQNQEYKLGPESSEANHVLFNTLHQKYLGDFCGDEMNPGYINISINKNHICMFVTDSSTGEERLHSIVMFYFKSPTVIYIDIFCTSTLRDYVNFRGGYRLMSLLYGICRLLGVHIELHSLDAAIEFYKKWGYKETLDSSKSLPKFTSTCDLRNEMSFKDVAKKVIATTSVLSGIKGFAGTPEQEKAFAKAQEEAFAKIEEAEDIKNSVFHTINILDRVNSGSTEDDAEAEAEAEPEAEVEVEVVYHNNDYWKVTNKDFDADGNVISYNLYIEDEEGNMKMSLCVPAQNVEIMDDHSKRLMNEKVREKKSWLAEKREKDKKLVLKSYRGFNHTSRSHVRAGTKGLKHKVVLGIKGGSRKQPRKTKKRKTKRNSKKK